MPDSAFPTGQKIGSQRGEGQGGDWDEWYQRAQKIFDDLHASGKSSEEIFVTLYGDLKLLASMRAERHPPAASMQATRLLGDLYVRLFVSRSADELSWESAGQFVTYVARAMKGVLIDHARQLASSGQLAPAEGLGTQGTNLTLERVERALWIDDLLDRLENDNAEPERAAIARRQANMVRLRLFLGYTEEETAQMLGCSSETVTKELRKAKAKLATYPRRDAPAATSDSFSDAVTRVDPRSRDRSREEG